MDTFPYGSLSHGYALGTPRWRILDSGIAVMELGNGVLRTRDELGQVLCAIELRWEALLLADTVTLWTFFAAHRIDTFLWQDTGRGPLSTALAQYWECRFDPRTPPTIVPRDGTYDLYDGEILLLPVVPTVASP
jgi:hypothetical protein